MKKRKRNVVVAFAGALLLAGGGTGSATAATESNGDSGIQDNACSQGAMCTYTGAGAGGTKYETDSNWSGSLTIRSYFNNGNYGGADEQWDHAVLTYKQGKTEKTLCVHPYDEPDRPLYRGTFPEDVTLTAVNWVADC